jgi:hypothetical protein
MKDLKNPLPALLYKNMAIILSPVYQGLGRVTALEPEHGEDQRADDLPTL